MAPLPIVKQRKPSAYMGFRCSYFCSNEIRIIDAFLDAGAVILLTTKTPNPTKQAGTPASQINLLH